MKTFIIRYGELWLKGDKVKANFIHILISNIQTILPKNAKLSYKDNYLYLTATPTKKLLDNLSKISGITSFSVTDKIDNSIKTLSNKSLQIANSQKQISTFAIDAKRDKSYPLKSPQIEATIGEHILKNTSLKVNLKNPDLTIYLKIQKDTTFIYSNKIKGLGGLPLKTAGKIVSLISHGLDSPVATILLIKRGCQIYPIHFDLDTYAKDNSIKNLFNQIATYSIGSPFEPLIFPYKETLKFIQKNFPPSYTCIFCKRGMIKIANLYAKKVNASAISTGDNLGQVASQTLTNLSSITQASSLPILRPLITFDKQETITLSKKYNLYDFSIKDTSPCLFVPKSPKTTSSIDKVLDLEKETDFDSFLINQFNT